jgi:hypothetical protein
MTSHRRRDRAIESVLAEYRHQQHRRTDRKERMTGPTKLKTVGIAPKTIAATALPLVAGVALLLLDKLAGAAIDDTLWWTLLASSPALGLGTYSAPAAPALPARARKRTGESGQGLIELVIVVLVILILVFVLLRVA